MTDCSISLLVHEHFAAQFLRANSDAINSILRRMPCEVVVAGTFDSPSEVCEFPIRIVSTKQLFYNQSLLTALRHARSSFCMWCDASDHLQSECLIQAAEKLHNARDAVAIVGGMKTIDQGFKQSLSPAGTLMRRGTALRFVRSHEFGLLGHFETIAQLRQAGPILVQSEILSKKQRISPHAGWHYTVEAGFFDPDRAERYSGYLRIYDPITLDRYLADAEHFLVFWREAGFHDGNSNTDRMFAKRGALYIEAARQALADTHATLALSYYMRALVANRTDDKGEHVTKSLAIDVDTLLPQALAEQIIYLGGILEVRRIRIEDHQSTRALGRHLPADVSWQEPDILANSDDPFDLLVFATRQRQDEFERSNKGAVRAVVSLEQLSDCIALPIKKWPRQVL